MSIQPPVQSLIQTSREQSSWGAKQLSLGLILVLSLFLAGCAVPTPAPASSPADAPPASEGTTASEGITGEADAPETNLSDGCVENYAEGIDYFPQKARVEYASGFTLDYADNYKIVTVTDPWQGAEQSFTYVLVQCGTPAPEGYDPSQIIEVPVQSIVALSTTYLPHLETLGAVDRLVGIDSYMWTNNESVRARIDTGAVAEVGGGSSINIEVLLDLDPDLVMTYGIGIAEYDAHPMLIEAGVPVALNGDFVEQDPLGRTEWIEFLALFLNKDGEAQDVMQGIAAEYNEVAALAASADSEPTVLIGSMYDGTWWVSGQESYTARLLSEAGVDYLWSNEGGIASMPMDFETVLDRAADADYWINPDNSFWNTADDVLASDERYAEFAPLEAGRLYNNNAIANENGGLAFYESGAANPQTVLKDLVKIFHPDLLPDHELVYYQVVE